MKSIVLFFIAVLPFVAMCQGLDSTKPIRAIGLTFSMDQNYRSLDFSPPNELVEEFRNRMEIPNDGFSVGLNTHYSLGRRLWLETGLQFLNKSYKTKSEQLEWVADGSFPDRARAIYRYKYLSLPLGVSYGVFVSTRLRIFVSADVAANLFLSRKTKVISYTDGDRERDASAKQAGYRRFNLFASAGAGIDYRLANSWMLRIKPYFQRTLTSVVVERSAREYIYTIGAQVGLYALL